MPISVFKQKYECKKNEWKSIITDIQKLNKERYKLEERQKNLALELKTLIDILEKEEANEDNDEKLNECNKISTKLNNHIINMNNSSDEDSDSSDDSTVNIILGKK